MGMTIAELETELEQIDAETQRLNAEVYGLLNDGDEATATERQERLDFVDTRRFVLHHRRNALADALRSTRAWGPNPKYLYIPPAFRGVRVGIAGAKG